MSTNEFIVCLLKKNILNDKLIVNYSAIFRDKVYLFSSFLMSRLNLSG